MVADLKLGFQRCVFNDVGTTLVDSVKPWIGNSLSPPGTYLQSMNFQPRLRRLVNQPDNVILMCYPCPDVHHGNRRYAPHEKKDEMSPDLVCDR